MKGYVEVLDKRDEWLKYYLLNSGYKLSEFRNDLDFYYLGKNGNQYCDLRCPYIFTLNDGVYPTININKDIIFKQENNLLTVLGLLKLMIENRHGYRNRILILGFGDLAQKIAHCLKQYHNTITIANRNNKDDVIIKQRGYQHVDLKHIEGEFDVIINTIPKETICYQTFDKSVIYDLATTISINHASYYSYRSLPGMFFPRQSAKLIFHTMDRVMRNVKK
ncbi:MULTISPECIES: NAD(P)-dependent oxidoreductase [Coprobacillaceae]|uniref:NAD(P)-dependent oxidoreductase n=1 Tax=Coprobacillaceae TaxID=2810280 RepID=UPI00131437C3|nr:MULTISPECIES: NAD(P)-dependent oxidoreductase [Coprobacillaceae]